MKISKLLHKIVLAFTLSALLVPASGQAVTTLTSRSLLLGSSAATASTTYTMTFKPSANENIGAVHFELCDSPVEGGGCTQPLSGSLAGAALNTAVPTTSPFGTFAAGTGGHSATATSFWIDNGTPQGVTSGVSYTVQLTSVVNPNVANYQFYIRATTFSNTAGTLQNEFGGMAASTAGQITITGNMPESLVFCVGITISTDCTTIGGGTSVNFGTFSPLSTSSSTSVMQASTNAAAGYAITLVGTTMSSGANTIPAMGTQTINSSGCAVSCDSTPGTSQFGTNVRNNAIPNVGTDVAGLGTAAGVGGYNIPDKFRFFTADTVASVAAPTKANTFTNSYIVNVGGDQAAGQYTATMTYICTGTF